MKTLFFSVTLVMLVAASTAASGPTFRTFIAPAPIISTDGLLVLAQDCRFCDEDEDSGRPKSGWRWQLDWRGAFGG